MDRDSFSQKVLKKVMSFLLTENPGSYIPTLNPQIE